MIGGRTNHVEASLLSFFVIYVGWWMRCQLAGITSQWLNAWNHFVYVFEVCVRETYQMYEKCMWIFDLQTFPQFSRSYKKMLTEIIMLYKSCMFQLSNGILTIEIGTVVRALLASKIFHSANQKRYMFNPVFPECTLV